MLKIKLLLIRNFLLCITIAVFLAFSSMCVNAGDMSQHPQANDGIPSEYIKDGIVYDFAYDATCREINATIISGKRCTSKKLDFEEFKWEWTDNKGEKQDEEIAYIKAIGEGAFKGNKKIASIRMSDTERIGKGAFQNCINLKKVVLGILHDEVVSVVTKDCFKGCKNLDEVTLNVTGLTSIEKNAFKGTKNGITFYIADARGENRNQMIKNYRKDKKKLQRLLKGSGVKNPKFVWTMDFSVE